jgi:hypothetical protein
VVHACADYAPFWIALETDRPRMTSIGDAENAA